MTERVTARHRAAAGATRRRPKVRSKSALAFSTLLRTKLHPPVLRSNVFWRTRLLSVLQDAIASSAVTLVCAPAGYGKTTLLATLLQTCPKFTFAWLSLDEDDNDPKQFFVALVEALRRAEPGFGSSIKSVLEVQNPGIVPRRVATLLVNALAELPAGAFALVLDDLHRVTEPAVHASLEYLIDNLPAELHVIIATRHEPPLPLTRWRARRLLAEIRTEDLRLTREEAAELLNGALGLGLSDSALDQLQERTEGWAAALTLIAGALLRGPQSKRSQIALDVERMDRVVFDYLADEVLSLLGKDERTFLLDTSILPELTPELCGAVTGRTDAADALEKLYQRSLFVTSLEEKGQVFRYHDLFRDFLQHRLGRERPQHVLELHRRAAVAEKIPSRAIAHLLAARMWIEAAQRIEEIGDQMLWQGAVATLRGWASMLPEEVRAHRPRLLCQLAIAAWLRHELLEVSRLVEQAVPEFEAAGDATGLGSALVMLSSPRIALGDFEAGAALCDRAGSYPLTERTRATLAVNRAWLELGRGNISRVAPQIDSAIDVVECSRTPEILHVFHRGIHSHLLGAPGMVRCFERFCGLDPRAADQEDMVGGTVLKLRAWTHAWRGRLSAALSDGRRALAISDRLGGLRWLTTDVSVLEAVGTALKGDAPESDRWFDLLFHELEQPDAADYSTSWLTFYLNALGRVRWMQGQLAEAREVEARMRSLANSREWPAASVARLVMRGLLEIADREYPKAQATLREAASLQERIPFPSFTSDARLMLAHLYLQWGRVREAAAQLEPVLVEHSREGTPGAILWEGRNVVAPLLKLAVDQGIIKPFAEQVLSILDSELVVRRPKSLAVPQTGQTLSAREVEVLRLIAKGASNAAIAQELFISVHTVKRHVASLLTKLEASSRTQAAAASRRLGLD